MSTATLSPRTAARRVSSCQIPDRFPDVDALSHGDVKAGRVPAFVWWASFDENRFVDVAEFQALTEPQREFVTASLSARGIALHAHDSRRLVTMRAEDVGQKIQMFSLRPDRRFCVEDPRVRHSDQIDITVRAFEKQDPRKVLREFLADLATFGVE